MPKEKTYKVQEIFDWYKKFENIEYDDDFFININDFDEFLVVSKESYLYNENNILKNLREYCIAAWPLKEEM